MASSVEASAIKSQFRYWAIGVTAFCVILRLFASHAIELLPEETYYWSYARHLDIGYLDHPPMVAWLIRLGTALFGDTEFGVRVGALCCGLVATFFNFRLTVNLFGKPAGYVALILMQTLPFFFFAGMLMTPDAPLTAAWAASLYFLERALIGQQTKAWLYAGVCLGLGLLSKYTIALVGVAALLYMLIDPVARRGFRQYQPYAAAVIAGVIFSPVIFWNYEHHWASFAFQTSRRLAEHPQFALHKLLGSALGLMSPLGLVTAATVLLGLRSTPHMSAVVGSAAVDQSASVSKAPAISQSTGISKSPGVAIARWYSSWRFLRMEILVPLAVFTVFSLRHEVKLDWTGAPWIAAIPAMACGIIAWSGGVAPRRHRWQLALWPVTIGVLLAMYSTGLSYLAVGLPGVGYSKQMELAPVGWREFGRQIDSVAREIEGEGGTRAGAASASGGAGNDATNLLGASDGSTNGHPLLIVGMDRYAIASELAFYAPDQARAVARTTAMHLFGGMGLMYEQWFPIAEQSGSTLLLVAWDARDLEDSRLASHVERLGPLRSGILQRGGHLIRTYYFRTAHGYK